jgi:predicted transcriptional regulator
MKVLISVKPAVAQAMIAGKKRFEYRKSLFKRPNVTAIVIYATQPWGKVVGEFTIRQIIQGKPTTLWQQTGVGSGTTVAAFQAYFAGCQKGYAIEVDQLTVYETPLTLTQLDRRLQTAPRSYRYLDG